MLEEKMYYLFFLSTENNITKSLSYEEAIKEYAAKECRKKSIIEGASQLVNKNIVIFWIL